MSALHFAEDQRPLLKLAPLTTNAKTGSQNLLAEPQTKLAVLSRPISQLTPEIFAKRETLKPDASPEGILASFIHNSLQDGADAYDVAAELLMAFGSVGGVLRASERDLRRIVHKRSDELHFIFTAVRNAALEVAKSTLDVRPVISTSEEIFEYARVRLGHETSYVLCVIYLDTNMRILEIEEHSRGTTDSVAFYPREIVKKAVQAGCVNVILLRNTLKDKPGMSSSDFDGLSAIESNLGLFDITLHDYIIVGHQTSLSLRSAHIIVGSP